MDDRGEVELPDDNALNASSLTVDELAISVNFRVTFAVDSGFIATIDVILEGLKYARSSWSLTAWIVT